MIDKELLNKTVEEAITNTDLFIVEIKVNPGNSIVVELDSETGIDIDTCADITRKIESVFDREVEDYELEVGSAGLTSPFKVKGQYLKNIGNEVEVLADGQKMFGVLIDANEENFSVDVQVKEKGKKKPVIVTKVFDYKNVKYTKYNLKFN